MLERDINPIVSSCNPLWHVDWYTIVGKIIKFIFMCVKQRLDNERKDIQISKKQI